MTSDCASTAGSKASPGEPATRPGPPRRSPGSSSPIVRPLTALVVLQALLALAHPLAPHHWLADVLASFAPHGLAVALACALAAAVLGARRTALAALAVGIAHGAFLAAAAGPVPGSRNAAGAPLRTVTILQWNLRGDNPDREAAARWLAEQATEMDVIALFEVRPGWATALAPLVAAYPHALVEPRPGVFGIAVLSRLPGTRLSLLPGDPRRTDVLLETSGARVSGGLWLVATHPVPPLSAALREMRNAQIASLAALVPPAGASQVILGDLNATPWSPAVVDLRRATGLADAQRGHGYSPTWAPGPLPTWLGVPIDLTLVSDTIAVHGRETGPRLRSDHAPVITRLRIPLKVATDG